MRKMATVLALLAGLVVLAVVAKNVIAKTAVVGGVKAMTGLNLQIDRMDVGVLSSAIGIRGLTLQNPSGFPDQVMLDLPEVYVNYDPVAFLKRQVHLKEVRLDLKEFNVIKDRQGRLNLDALQVVRDSHRGAASETRPKSGAAAKAPELRIDRLQLKIGKVVYKDYSHGDSPAVQEFAINIDERYEHITNPQMVAGLIVSRALMQTTIAKLTGLDVRAIQSQMEAQFQQAAQAVTGVVDTAAKQLPDGAVKQLKASTEQITGTATNVVGDATAVARGAAGTGKEAVNAAADTVKKTGESLKKVLPFGN